MLNTVNSVGFEERVPLVPEQILKRYNVHVPTDTRFRAAARLLADRWRRENSLPAGTYVDARGTKRTLGSLLGERAARAGMNFASPTVKAVADRELIYRQSGALIDAHRLRANMLTSQALCFNLFAPLKADLQLATKIVLELFPSFFATVTDIHFEWAPARGNLRFGGDHSALDCLVVGTGRNGERTFVGIEQKYSEDLRESAPRIVNDRYRDVAKSSQIFIDPYEPALREGRHRQTFREHMLTQILIEQGIADQGRFVVIAPLANHDVQRASDDYSGHLVELRRGQVGFHYLPMERVLEAYAACREEGYAQSLYRRYLDFSRLDRELGLSELGKEITAPLALPT
ncbi:MAG TPA: hypothetical protein VG757_01855 [Devosia sp.]|nr:hypothetical protein [Devosia sp.]